MQIKRNNANSVFPNVERCREAKVDSSMTYKKLTLRNDALSKILKSGKPVSESSLSIFAKDCGVENWRSLALAATNEGFANSSFDAVDYYHWHEELSGENLESVQQLSTLTWRELDTLWGQPSVFIPYETIQRNRCTERVDRLFVVGADYGQPRRRSIILRTLLRHKQLGFNTVVLPHARLAKKGLDKFDHFLSFDFSALAIAIVNNHSAIFCDMSLGASAGTPNSFRTMETAYLQQTIDCVANFHARKAVANEDWLKQHRQDLTRDIHQSVERDVKEILLLANETSM